MASCLKSCGRCDMDALRKRPRKANFRGFPAAESLACLYCGLAAQHFGSGLAFATVTRSMWLSDMTLSKLVKELGFDAEVHGFRTSFRTWAQERTNFPREIAEAALAHGIRDKAEAAYARSNHIEKRRKMMEAWAAFLATRSCSVFPLSVGA